MRNQRISAQAVHRTIMIEIQKARRELRSTSNLEKALSLVQERIRLIDLANEGSECGLRYAPGSVAQDAEH